MYREIKVIPSLLKKRNPFSVVTKVASSSEDKVQGFIGATPREVTMPLLMTWDAPGIRILHNNGVLMDVDCYVLDHDNRVQQVINLKAENGANFMTSPTRTIIEIPDVLEGININLGDVIVMGEDS